MQVRFQHQDQQPDVLSSAEQEAFAALFDLKVEEVLAEEKEKYAGRTMPFHCVPRERQFQGMPVSDFAYESPMVLSQARDLQQGKGVFVIKSQIDHAPGRSMQWEWIVFHVEADGTVIRGHRECRWRGELEQDNVVRLEAAELL